MPAVFPYDAREQPPVPVVFATVGTVDGSRASDVWWLVDSGADRTIIPLPLAEELQLEELDRIEFEGFDGSSTSLAIVQVRLAVQGGPRFVLNAVVGPSELEPLLGRDVLNQMRIVHDGPALKIEIG